MLTRLKVDNFQSLTSADVELGKLTVIVGPSNSGKSAVVRAIRAACHNVRSPSIVTAGHKKTTISLSTTDGDTVVLERGEGVARYSLHIDGGSPEIFTKIAASVPDDVTKILAMPPGGPNFTTQFDKPYLLGESSTEVARVLSDLTNTHVVLGAAREANRARLAASTELTVRVKDKDRLDAKLKEFDDLEEREVLLYGASGLLDEAEARSLKAAQLGQLIQKVSSCAAAREELLRSTATQAPRDLTPAREAIDRLSRLSELVKKIVQLVERNEDLKRETAKATEEVETARRREKELIEELGTCPICGQATA